MSDKHSPEMKQILDMLTGDGPFRSIDYAKREVASRMRDYNACPQAGLGGLSPNEMGELLYGDWKLQGALRLDERITLEQLSGSPILTDARTLLEYVRDEGPLRETAARNLPRADVAALRPRLRMPANPLVVRNYIVTRSSNEGDVPWLSELRYVLLFGKLLARRKGLRSTRLGNTLLSAARAGELHAHLFRTLFRVLDLAVLDGADRHPRLQRTLAFSLYQLQSAAREWATPQILAQSAWLESAKDPPDAVDLRYDDLRYITFQLRVLDPLVQFGLLEIRSSPDEGMLRHNVEYRCAPLFGRFLTFDFRRG